MTLHRQISLFCILLIGASQVYAADTIELEKGSIVGNKESPKAIYIVPWRSLSQSNVSSLDISTLLDEELTFLDREVFKRQIELYELTKLKK